MDLNRYRLTPWKRFIRKLSQLFRGLGKGIAGFFVRLFHAVVGFFVGIGRGFKGLGKGIAGFFVRLFHAVVGFFVGIGRGFKEFGQNFWHGDALTKSSHFVLGLSHLFRGQIVRGILYLLLETAFVLYMVFFGGRYLVMCFENFIGGGSIGRVETHDYWNEDEGIHDKIVGDNSFLILLYGILTLFVIVFFIICYIGATKESYELEQCHIIGKKPQTFRKDINNLLDNKFHLTLLSLPMVGLFVFTIIPLVTMILIAFTNYDGDHLVPEHLFQWVGFDNFKELFTEESKLGDTFWRVLGWTLIWAVLATLTSYIFGMLLAMLINRKGIKLKKLYRTLFVATIAVPQFVSLLIMSKMLDSGGGIITQLIERIFDYRLKFGVDINTTRICIVIVNMWIGVPYSMLMCSGILMNIPSDLYESARIDGASPARRFFKITLPYMLFVTGPYLITQFIGNINNFNVIFLLSGGGPGDNMLYSKGAQGTDLLITWLYKLSLDDQKNYKLASVIGILVFIISATFSLIVYNKSSAVKGEDNFQ